MKIFGTTDIVGRLNASTGSFLKYGLANTDTTPDFVVAGTDSKLKKMSKSNRSIIGHGVFDYMIFSDNGGSSFGVSVPDVRGSVIGLRTQHIGKNTVFSLTNNRYSLYDGVKSRLTVTKDGGATFSLTHEFSDIITFDMQWIDENVGYVAGAKLEVGTTTEAVSWVKFRSTNAFAMSTSADAANNIGIASYTGSIFRTEDGGVTFTEYVTPSQLSGDVITSIAIDPVNTSNMLIGTENGNVYLSTDSGQAWTAKLNLGVCINRIKYAFNNPSVIYLCTDSLAYDSGRIWKSVNSGASWSRTEFLLSGGPRISYDDPLYDIEVPSEDIVIAVGGNPNKILRTENGGTSWTVVNSNINDLITPIKSIKNINFGNNGAFYAALTDNVLYYYQYRISPGAPEFLYTKTQWALYRFAHETIDFDIVSHADQDKPTLNSIFVLTNGNALNNNTYAVYTYQHLNANTGETISQPFTFQCTGTPTKIWAKNSTELYVITTDGEIIKGTKSDSAINTEIIFTTENSGLSSTSLNSISGNSTKLYAGGDGGVVVYNTYANDTWTQTSEALTTYTDESIIKLQVISDDVVYALTKDSSSITHFYVTSNGGDSWTEFSYEGSNEDAYKSIVDFYVHDASYIFGLCGDGTSMISTDNGFSTSVKYQNFFSTQMFTFALDKKNSENAPSDFIFMSGNRFGITQFNIFLNRKVDIGPYGVERLGRYILMSIAGSPGYPFWIGGGITSPARGGRPDIGDLGAEPLLLRSDNSGLDWYNYTTFIFPSEPFDTTVAGGDFAITSISEGQYVIEDKADIFNIYKSDPSAVKFDSINSNLFNQNKEYDNVNSDGITKIRFYNKDNGWAVGNINPEEYKFVDSTVNLDAGKFAYTEDGGQSWQLYPYNEIPDVQEIDSIVSIFPVQQGFGNYDFKLVANIVKENPDGTFKSGIYGLYGGTANSDKAFELLQDTSPYNLGDVFFVNESSGSVIYYNDNSGGVFNTVDGGQTWTPVSITDARFTKYNHIQYVTQKTGFISGKYLSFPALYKTKNGGQTWVKLTTPADSNSGVSMTAVHFFNEEIGVIAANNEIYKTQNSGSSWTLTHTVDSPDADPSLDAIITDLKFSIDKKIGIAVGYRPVDLNVIGEHFILKSTDEGNTWVEVDSQHTEIDLEYGQPIPPNQASALYTIAFKEQIQIPDDVVPETPEDPDDPVDPIDDPLDCFTTKFMSSSYYNFENFAYKCTVDGKYPIYHPNNSNNIGLGKGIFGQNTSVAKTILKNTITQGAALGVNVLGSSRTSTGDTAVGFGAMDNIINSSKNVAVGYKALSKTIDNNIKNQSSVISNISAISATGQVYTSINGGSVWSISTLNETGSFYINSSSFSPPSSSILVNKAVSLNKNTSLLLANDVEYGSGTKYNTYISRTSARDQVVNTIYTSSEYTFTGLYAYNSNIVYAIESTIPTMFISYNGGLTWQSGSVELDETTIINSLDFNDASTAVLVGSNIWLIQSGSDNTWVSSSYTGSHVLNSVKFIDKSTVFAVGESGSIYKSTNSGIDWVFLDNNVYTSSFNDISIQSGRILVAGDSGSIIYTDNKGTTWLTSSADVALTLFNVNQITSLNQEELLARTNIGLISSTDSGTTWKSTSSPSILPTYDFDIISVVSKEYSSANDTTSYTNDIPNTLTGEKTQITTANENVAIGNEAVLNSLNPVRMVGVGSNALKNAYSYESILPNRGELILADKFDLTENANITASSLYPNTYGQVAIGAYSQFNSVNTKFNTSIGYASLYNTDNSSDNVAVGFYSQHLSTKNRNISIGTWTLGLNGNDTSIENSYSGGDDNIAIGYKAMMKNIESERYIQIQNANSSLSSSAYSNLGTKNIAIGNYALTDVNGSYNVVSIGYGTLSQRATDITDSVFIGNYAGSNYKTVTGSYDSGSVNTDWIPTKVVSIGNNSTQNQSGIDLVVIGANALRGIPGATEASINDLIDNKLDLTSDYGILLGSSVYFPSNPKTRPTDRNYYGFGNFSKNINKVITNDTTKDYTVGWRDINYVKPDDLIVDSILHKYFIYNRNTAYGILTGRRDKNGPAYYYLIKTDELSVSDPVWKPIVHKNTNKEVSRLVTLNTINATATSNPVDLHVASEDVIYVLRKHTKEGLPTGLDASYDRGVTFETVSDFTYAYNTFPVPIPGLSYVAVQYKAMTFSSETNGMLFGYDPLTDAPIVSTTTDGGQTWSIGTPRGLEDEGSGIHLESVWFNQDHSIGFAVGNYGAIYKYDGGTWEKKLGGTKTETQSDFQNLVWNTINAKSIYFSYVQFYDELTGYAVGYGQYGGNDFFTTVVAKTTDGGDTWSFTEDRDQFLIGCEANENGIGRKRISSSIPYSFVVLDRDRAIIGVDQGFYLITNDGGNNWEQSRPFWETRLGSLCSYPCDPFVVNVLAYKKLISDDILAQYSGSLAISSGSVVVGSDAQSALKTVYENVAIGNKVQYMSSGSAIDSVQIGAFNSYTASLVLDTVSVGKQSIYNTNFSTKTTAIGVRSLYQFKDELSGAPYPVIGTTPGGSTREWQGDTCITKNIASPFTSSCNTVVGFEAGRTLLRGHSNVYIGCNSGRGIKFQDAVTYGQNNIIIGTNARKSENDISNEIAIGNLDHTAAWLWGQHAAPNPWRLASDGRDKADTGSFALGLDLIRKIQPKYFKWDVRANYPSGSTPDGTFKAEVNSYGYIAQDLEIASLELGYSGSLMVTEVTGAYASESGYYDQKTILPGMIDLVTVNAIKQLDQLVSYLSGSKYAENIGDGINTTYSVTHSLNTRDVVAMVYSNLNENVVYPTMSIDTADTILVSFNTVPSLNEYRIVVKR